MAVADMTIWLLVAAKSIWPYIIIKLPREN